MTDQEKKEAIHSLLRSDGWGLICNYMQSKAEGARLKLTISEETPELTDVRFTQGWLKCFGTMMNKIKEWKEYKEEE